MGLLTGGADNALPRGLLDPMRVKAMREQAARAPMNAARTPQVVTRAPTGYAQNPNAGIGKGLMTVGQALSGIADQRKAAQAKEKEEATIAGFIETLPEAERQQAAAIAGTPEGRKKLFSLAVDRMKPQEAEEITYYGPNGAEQSAKAGSVKEKLLLQSGYAINKPQADTDFVTLIDPKNKSGKSFAKGSPEHQQALRMGYLPRDVYATLQPKEPLAKVEVSVPGKEADPYAGPLGEAWKSKLSEMAVAGQEAGATIARLDAVGRLADEVATGPMADGKYLVSKYANYLGIDPEKFGLPTNYSAQEAFVAMSGEFVMGQIQNTKGSISEKEMAFFERISPSMANTPEGNKLLVSILKRKAVREQKILKAMEAAEVNGVVPRSFRGTIEKIYAENPLYTPEEQEILLGSGGDDKLTKPKTGAGGGPNLSSPNSVKTITDPAGLGKPMSEYTDEELIKAYNGG